VIYWKWKDIIGLQAGLRMVIGCMNRFNEASLYDQELVKELHTLNPDIYPLEKARETVETFYPYMDRIGWNWSPKEWARKLHNILEKGYNTPEKWEEKLAERERLLGIQETSMTTPVQAVEVTVAELIQAIRDMNVQIKMTESMAESFLQNIAKVEHGGLPPFLPAKFLQTKKVLTD
jgi:hypothetical protein